MEISKQSYPLYPSSFYHIYNRANSGRKLFYQERNYIYFLQKMSSYLSDYVDFFAYCLMPNHFHWLVRIKSETQIKLKLTQSQRLSQFKFEKILSIQMNYLLAGYTKAINKQNDEHGSLFEKNFRRKPIEDNDYFRHLVYYIHNNPVKHGFVDKMEDWQYSSYNRLINDKPSKLQKAELLDWFDGKQNYLDFHSKYQDLKSIESLMIEE